MGRWQIRNKKQKIRKLETVYNGLTIKVSQLSYFLFYVSYFLLKLIASWALVAT